MIHGAFPQGKLLPSTLLMTILLMWAQQASMAADPEAPSPGTPSAPPPVLSQSGQVERIHVGLLEIGMMAGYGKAMLIGATQDDRRQYAILNPRFGVFLTDVMGRVPYKGSVELIAEPIGMFQFEPKQLYAVGLSALVRYNFWTGSKIIPFLDAGAGVMGTNFGPPEQGSIFNFQLQAGAGLHIFVKRGLALTLQYRLHHISNAGTADPNRGINSNIFLAGLSIFY